ncbi:MAG: protein-export chaperone SecB [Hyphomicrobiaceae bacterium]
MAETNGPKPADGMAAGATPAIFRVLAQYVKDMSFESPNAPETLKHLTERPKLNIEVNVSAAGMEPNTHEVTIHLEATAARANGGQTLYNVEIDYAGLFHIEHVPDDRLPPLLMINCPALIYPFLRRLVCDLTREGGFPPLLLDPIDFAGLYLKNLADREKAGQKTMA